MIEKPRDQIDPGVFYCDPDIKNAMTAGVMALVFIQNKYQSCLSSMRTWYLLASIGPKLPA